MVFFLFSYCIVSCRSFVDYLVMDKGLGLVIFCVFVCVKFILGCSYEVLLVFIIVKLVVLFFICFYGFCFLL